MSPDVRKARRNYFSYVATLVICGFTFLLTGCPIKLQPPLQPTEPIPGITTAKVAELVMQRFEQFRSLRGLGKVSIQSWEERYRFSEVFVLEKPARFRLETLGFLDQPAIFLTSDENELLLYAKKQNACYRGVASQENLFKLSGLNLSVEEAILIFSGNPPYRSQINAEWGLPLSKTLYLLERTSLQYNLMQRIWFDTTTQTITHLEESMLTNGKVVLAIDFNDYRAEAGAYPIPRVILINRPLDHTLVNIEYKSFDVNQPLDAALFKFTPPSDAKKYFIDDKTADQIERLAPYKEFQVKDKEPQ